MLKHKWPVSHCDSHIVHASDGSLVATMTRNNRTTIYRLVGGGWRRVFQLNNTRFLNLHRHGKMLYGRTAYVPMNLEPGLTTWHEGIKPNCRPRSFGHGCLCYATETGHMALLDTCAASVVRVVSGNQFTSSLTIHDDVDQQVLDKTIRIPGYPGSFYVHDLFPGAGDMSVVVVYLPGREVFWKVGFVKHQHVAKDVFYDLSSIHQHVVSPWQWHYNPVTTGILTCTRSGCHYWLNGVLTWNAFWLRANLDWKSWPAACFSPDGRTLCIGVGNGIVIFLDTADGREKYVLDLGFRRRNTFDVSWSPDGLTVAVALTDGVVVVDVDF